MALIQGDNDANVLTGTASADTIVALGGNDTITGGGRNDTIDAGFGIDTVVLSGNRSQYQFTMQVNPNTWLNEPNYEVHFTLNTFDQVSLRDGNDQVQDLEYLQFADGTVRWHDVPVSYTVDPQTDTESFVVVAGGTMNDTMVGHDGPDSFIGGLGNDSMDGGGGFDVVEYMAMNTYVTMLPMAGGMSINLEAGHASGVWGFDTFVNMEGATGTDYPDLIFGSTVGNLLYGYGGNDTLAGGDGDDTIDGGAGLDWALFSGNAADYTMSFFDVQRIVGDTVGNGGYDSLASVERLQFDDLGLAFDLSGHAGTSARLIGVLMGADFVRVPVVEQIVIEALDSGLTAEQLAAAAITALYPDDTPQQLAQLMYTNVLHTPASPEVVDYLVGVMAASSPAWLAAYASTLAENDASIDYVGLLGTGVPFLPIVSF